MAISLLATSLGAQCCFGDSHSSSGIVDVKFALRETEITIREPIVIDVIVGNQSASPVSLDLGSDDLQAFSFLIKLDDVEIAEIRPAYPYQGFRFTGRVQIEAGSEYRTSLLLTHWLRPEKPGKYTLTARFVASAGIGGAEGHRIAHSQALVLDVLPHDSRRLKQRMEALTESASRVDDLVVAGRAAEALSLIDDPEAAEYLGRVARRGPAVEYEAVRGLVRLKTPEAVRILISLLASDDPHSVQTVCLSLHQLATQVDDAVLRRLILDALRMHGMEGECREPGR